MWLHFLAVGFLGDQRLYKRKSALEWHVCIAVTSLGTKSTNKPLRLHKKSKIMLHQQGNGITWV